MADTKISAFADLANPPPANSYVPVVVIGDTTNYKAPLGSGSPQAGQPTRFLTLAHHHSGNEDGNSESATTGIPIPDSTMAEGSLYAVSVQTKAVKSSDGSLVTVGFAPAVGASHTNSSMIVLRETGGTAFAFLLDGTISDSAVGTPSSFSNSPEANSDSQFFSAGVSVSGNALVARFAGLSTNTPTDWTINVQLMPIAP